MNSTPINFKNTAKKVRVDGEEEKNLGEVKLMRREEMRNFFEGFKIKFGTCGRSK